MDKPQWSMVSTTVCQQTIERGEINLLDINSKLIVNNVKFGYPFQCYCDAISNAWISTHKGFI